MKVYLAFLVIFSCMHCCMEISAQETVSAPIRTPEQEATLQTQKLQKELNLNREQQQAVYEINLKHARERQVSNSRSQALERVKNKNSAIKQVLTHDQYDQLQNKRYERYPVGGNTYINRNVPQERQVQPATERRSTESVTPQTNREITRPPTRNVPIDRDVRINPAPIPTRRIPINPSSSSSGSNDRSQRR